MASGMTGDTSDIDSCSENLQETLELVSRGDVNGSLALSQHLERYHMAKWAYGGEEQQIIRVLQSFDEQVANPLQACPGAAILRVSFRNFYKAYVRGRNVGGVVQTLAAEIDKARVLIPAGSPDNETMRRRLQNGFDVIQREIEVGERDEINGFHEVLEAFFNDQSVEIFFQQHSADDNVNDAKKTLNSLRQHLTVVSASGDGSSIDIGAVPESAFVGPSTSPSDADESGALSPPVPEGNDIEENVGFLDKLRGQVLEIFGSHSELVNSWEKFFALASLGLVFYAIARGMEKQDASSVAGSLGEVASTASVAVDEVDSATTAAAAASPALSLVLAPRIRLLMKFLQQRVNVFRTIARCFPR